MADQKYRHEIKHFIHTSDRITLSSKLRSLLSLDPFAKEDGTYKIRSLYFDNYSDKALLEKINGVNNREKFRIRFYNDDVSFIKLERKRKNRGLCMKDATKITYEQCKEIINGSTDWMKDTKDPLLLDLYMKMKDQYLKPKTIVDYTRQAFIYGPGNTRITIDSNIRTGIYETNILDLDIPTVPAVTPGLSVLEIKYDEFLPEIIQDLIQTNRHMSTAMSKYAACRIYG